MAKRRNKKPEISLLRKAKPGDLRGTALVRLDFNTEDEWRMEATLPTLRLLHKRADRVVIVSHRGRPDTSLIPSFATASAGRRTNRGIVGSNKVLSLRKNAVSLQKMLGYPVTFVPLFQMRFSALKRRIKGAPKGSIFLLENIRFLKGETAPQPQLARRLASLADFYVNDAFADSHRSAASIALVPRFLPSYAGLELEQELTFLGRVMRHPQRPLVVLLGGAKVGDKLGVIKYFRRKATCFLIGGVAANTLLMLKGRDVGRSRVDDDPRDRKKLKPILKYRNIVLPIDVRMENSAILDIGPKTEKLFARKLSTARTIIWSGPMGFIEKQPFDRGNLAVARAIVKNRKAFSVTGGGETVTFLKRHHLDKRFSFISTGGGAMLEFLAGKKLPGIEALKK
jgi:phosphoglycerate kinase